MFGVLRELRRDLLNPRVLLGALPQGLVIGTMLVIIECSLASMIFSGPLSGFAVRGAGLLIFSGMIMTLVVGLSSTLKGVVTVPQDMPGAILAGVVASLAASLGTLPPEAQYGTVVSLLLFTAMVSALCFYLMGRLSLSNLVRFLPYPVVGGFLAGSGLLLCVGGLTVMTGQAPGLEALGLYLHGQVLGKWLLGVAFALCVYFLLRVRPNVLVLPAALIVSIGAFFLCLLVLGLDVDAVRQQGWLVESLPSSGLWPAFSIQGLLEADWGAVLTLLPDVLSVALLSAIALLLNLGGIELGARTDIDMDRELRVGAMTNAVGGLLGGFTGYPSVSLSLLSQRAGVSSRLVSVFAAAVGLLVVFAGADILTFLPKPILGGLLFLLGLFFFDDWIFSGLKKLTAVDFGIVLVIVATVGAFGFLEGIGLGLLLAAAIFVFRFSRVSVIRREMDGSEVHSRVERPVPARVLLERSSGEIRVIELGGFIFFGSACFLSQRIGGLLKGKSGIRFLVIDLGGIDGFDVSAVNNFQRIAQMAFKAEVRLMLCRTPGALWRMLERNASPEVMVSVSRHDDLSRALEQAEEAILSRECSPTDGGQGCGHLFDLAFDRLDSQLQVMERFEEVVEAVDRISEERSFARGETIIEAGQPLTGAYLVLWGSVGEYLSRDGAEVRLRRIGRGNVLTPQGVLRGRIASTTCRAEEDGVLAFLPAEAVARLGAEAPERALKLYELLLGMAARA